MNDYMQNESYVKIGDEIPFDLFVSMLTGIPIKDFYKRYATLDTAPEMKDDEKSNME